MKLETPRPLTPSEIDIVEFILSADFPGVEALRSQVSGLHVVGRCDCGCPSIDLSVATSAVGAVGLESRLLPSEAEVVPLADEPPGQIIVFVDDGCLSGLEYVYYSETAPIGWPDPSRLTLAQPRDLRSGGS